MVSRFERSTTVGSSGHGVSTTRAGSRPTARAASTVSSVWLMVPSFGLAAITTGSASQVAHLVAQGQRDQQPAYALNDEKVRAS